MIRIMLATDNHIGYLERDPVRGQDSINTFREILQLAVKHDVSSYLVFFRGQRLQSCPKFLSPKDICCLAVVPLLNHRSVRETIPLL